MLAIASLSVAFLRYAGITSRERTVCLRGVSLSIASGEVVAVIGASGAGKSLLAHAVLGILPKNAQTEGEMSFAGVPLTPQRQIELRGRQIVLVPQSIACLDPLARIARQVELSARRAGISRTGFREAASRTLAGFGLDAVAAHAFPHQLSGGMARRVLLAMATVGEPALIIADEPTNGLDDVNAELVLRHLRLLADAGRSVMLISHDLRLALPVADRVVVISHGATVETAAAGQFRNGGDGLATAYARSLWRALPENDFTAKAAAGMRE